MRSVTLRGFFLFGVWLAVSQHALATCNNPGDSDAVVQHLKSVAQESLPPHVDKAVEAFGNASSLHLRARIAVTSEHTSNQPVAGIYEYWEKDGKYRMHFGIDVTETAVSELAYDGRQYQLALSLDSTLSVASADERSVPSGIPNPLFLLLQPLSVNTPDCLGCVLRLSDLRTLRDLRHATAIGNQALAPLDTSGSDVKITLTPTGNLASLVLSQGQGERVEQAEFSDYRAVEGTDMALPRSVRLLRTVSTEDSLLHVTIQYQIDDLELGSEIDDSVFTLDRSQFERIWDGDRQRFIKATYCPARQPAQ